MIGAEAVAAATALPWTWRGQLGLAEATVEQEARRDRILAGDGGAAALLLCEHPPVITLGRRGETAHILASDEALRAGGVEVMRLTRGGEVTYHGPGQLMIYPVVRIRGTVANHLERIAGVLAAILERCGVAGARWKCDPAGVWLDGRKIAACGLNVRQGVAIHGFALNVATPAEAWRQIVACGMHGNPMISLAEACRARGLAAPPTVDVLAAAIGPVLAAELA